MPEYGIVVMGATGFTGNLITRYLAHRLKARNPRNVKIAIAGRSKDKLAAQASVLRGLGLQVGTLCADATSAQDMLRVAQAGSAIINVAGPFAKYGERLVAAVAQTPGAAYFDLTGEMPWVDDMIQRYNAAARENGALLVPTCGFDSVPSDMTAYLAAKFTQDKLGSHCASVQVQQEAQGGASGGTIASALNLFEYPRGISRSLDPVLLNKVGIPGDAETQAEAMQAVARPSGVQAMPGMADFVVPHRDAGSGKWATAFVMGSVNTRVTRRSATLWAASSSSAGYNEPGQSVDVSEVALVQSLVVAWLMTVVPMLFSVLLAIGPLRRVAARLLPAPGTGPSVDQRSKSWFKTTAVAHVYGQPNTRVLARIQGGDAGYEDTAKMLSEAALTWLEQRDGGKLPATSAFTKLGFLTPATALGLPYIANLHAAGLSVRVAQAAASQSTQTALPDSDTASSLSDFLAQHDIEIPARIPDASAVLRAE